MLLKIEHKTHYAYSEVVDYTIQQLRLTPQNAHGQRLLHWDVRVNGNLHTFEDAHGNVTQTLVIDNPHQEVSITAFGEVETNIVETAMLETIPLPIYLRQTPLTQPDNAVKAFAATFAKQAKSAELILLMMKQIKAKIAYVKGSTEVKTTAAQAFALGEGVCQDQTHVLLACCREIGIPARYVSGYLFTDDARQMESHAWADIWLEGLGWQSFDVLNQCKTNGKHVRLAVGLDYREASPVSGMRVGGGDEAMKVSVQVEQIQQQSQQ
ncbi:MAG TPA: transglutaminase family protein [Methylophilaceae bacterium]|jgi:transglutaminase-like putative cysteine protease